MDASTGKVVASIARGTRVDALGWDPSKKLIYIPNGGEGTVTVGRVESLTKNGKLVVYEAVVRTGKRTTEIQVGPDGRTLARPE